MVRAAALYLLEVLCLLCALLGVWCIYPPAALILGGLVGVLGAEASLAQRRDAGKGVGG
ncbi:hypothetical protein [Streptomyces sp. NPDC004685]